MLSSLFAGLTAASERTYVSVYAATYSPSSFLELVAPVNVELSSRSRLAALAIGRPLADFWGLEWDVEGQVVRHWGDQTNFEFNALYLARWQLPILEELVAPAFAFGHGISWATEPPSLEPSGDPNEKSSEVLNYLMAELEFAPPSAGQWGGFVRVHHRSGVFGLIDGIKGGSNFVGAGIRYRF
ncbi:hypothetical protein [Marinobacter sp.]|uniref:hypothetical protein n=1 Tax=Marinobacter sp. TaxID=50741 RepID=UPI00384F7F06